MMCGFTEPAIGFAAGPDLPHSLTGVQIASGLYDSSPGDLRRIQPKILLVNFPLLIDNKGHDSRFSPV